MRIGMPGPGGPPDGCGSAAARPVVPSGVPGSGYASGSGFGSGPSVSGASAPGPAAFGTLASGAVVVGSRVRHQRPTLQEYRFASALRRSPAQAAEPVTRDLDGIPPLGEVEAGSGARAAVPTGVSAAPGDVGVLGTRCGRFGIGVAGVVGSGAAGSASVGGVVGGGGDVVSTRALARACGVVLCDPERRARPGTVARARALEPVRGLFRVERNATAFHGIYRESVSRFPVRRRVWDAYGRPSPFGTRTVPAPPVTASAAAAPTVPLTVVLVSPVTALPVTASAGEGAR
ncbi:hypothetical protein YW7DRAFT_01190 [Streptomyces sp. AmelKG-E11A]|nr:hypothetical protein YW7DRAFT_01190 [Streptomyces sp. AmelKG-E11A]